MTKIGEGSRCELVEPVGVGSCEELFSRWRSAVKAQVTAAVVRAEWCGVGLFVVGNVAMHKVGFDKFFLVKADPVRRCRRVRLIRLRSVVGWSNATGGGDFETGETLTLLVGFEDVLAMVVDFSGGFGCDKTFQYGVCVLLAGALGVKVG